LLFGCTEARHDARDLFVDVLKVEVDHLARGHIFKLALAVSLLQGIAVDGHVVLALFPLLEIGL
jgi:hypothetical protein